MKKSSTTAKPASKLRRQLQRWPTLLYRYKLGFLLGSNFLLLHHYDRNSKQNLSTAIKLLHCDSQQSRFYIAALLDEHAQWYQDIQLEPAGKTTYKQQKLQTHARVLPARDAHEVLLIYINKHPCAKKAKGRFYGYSIDNSEASIMTLGEQIKVIELSVQA